MIKECIARGFNLNLEDITCKQCDNYDVSWCLLWENIKDEFEFCRQFYPKGKVLK